MKKEESKVIAQKLQKIPNGTLALKHCRAGGTCRTLFEEQFRAVTAGKGCVEAYETFPGIEVSFNVFLASEVKFRHDASDSVLEIYYFRSGRMGWNMQGGTAVYLGSGDVTAHSMACCADSAMMFPLGYSEGISISVDLKQLSSICPEVLKNAGVEADQLRNRFCSGKPSAIPSCSDLEHIFAPLFSAPVSVRISLLKLKVLEIPNCRSQYTMPSPRRKAWRKTKMSPESLCVCFFSVSDLNFSEQNILRLELIFFRNGADHLAGHPCSDDTGGNVMGDDASRPDNRACPDGNAATDSGICADPDVFLQRNG